MEVHPSDKPTLPFGRYVIREHMAKGGMGEVFRAVAVGADGFEKPVVVKRLLPKFAGRPEVASLLAAEAKLMTRLSHPNIVQVIDFGRGDKDDYFLVMELVTGTDLGRFCDDHQARGERVSVPLALFITTQVLRGLAYAHASASADGKTLVHRDVSPGNVLLSTFGEVKVADFGVALFANSDGSNQDGWLVGKPGYAAPEQKERAEIDARADIYAVGAVLFQMLTGSPPVETAFDVRANLAEVREPDLAALVLRALAPHPDDRFGDAREMARAVEQVAQKQKLVASADDLAEAVTDVCGRALSKNRAVVVLSADEPDELSSGTELTHLGAEKEGHRFTIRLPNQSRVDAPGPAARLRRGGLARLVSGAALSGALLAGAGLAITLLVRGAHPGPPSPSATPSATSSRVDATGSVAPIDTAAPSASAPDGPQSEANEQSPRRPRSKNSAKQAAATTPEPSASCRGQIHFYATHGWMLSGGAGTVQAPGRYDWPCGTYALKAVSRLDPRDARSMTVTIREVAPTVVDLR